MRAVIVYEVIPESTRIYVVDDVSAVDWAWIRELHGRYRGFDGCPPELDASFDRLVAWLADKPPAYDPGAPSPNVPPVIDLSRRPARGRVYEPGEADFFLVHTGEAA